MKLQVEVMSKETIKPSSPTLSRLHNFQLSFLDQLSPPVYMPFIFFYESSPNTKFISSQEKSDRLKISLSETLTRFYPLAGRLVGNTSIDCNDAGVPYSEAWAQGRISEVVKDPIPDEFNKFLPRELDHVDDGILLAIQVTFFKCGGLAVGVCTCHKVADALSIVMFITSWAASSREDDNVLCPNFNSTNFFPPKNISGYEPRIGITKDKIAIRRFVFSNSIVDNLRSKYSTDKICPTRVEALSIFIWSRYATVVGANAKAKASSIERIYMIVHAVNLRTRMDPPLPENSFGNFYQVAMMNPSLDIGDDDKYCRGLVRKMRESLKNIDGEYVKKQLQEGREHLNLIVDRAERFSEGKMLSFNFTSLCRMGLYDRTDFGWGKPARVGSTRLTFKNLVTFMDTKEGDGIEAWINMEEEEMAKFEVDKELLAHV